MRKLLTIVGPTATGKTDLAISLAKKFNGELVSADSRQIYRGMDIGTGKREINDQLSILNDQLNSNFKKTSYRLPKYEKEGIGIWMYDVVNPNEEFSVSHYYSLATDVIADIIKRQKLPILVGGTGLYIKAILEGIETIEIPRNEELRRNLSSKTVSELQEILKLQAKDIWEMMNNSDRNNSRRLIRKIEIVSLCHPAFLWNPRDWRDPSSEPYPNTESRYNYYAVGLTTELEILKQRILARIKSRVENGSIEEVKRLIQKGYTFVLPSMNTMGYKEWKSYFAHPTEEEKLKAIEAWERDEVDYAKRQLTWFKKQKNIEWFDILSSEFPTRVKQAVTLWYTS